MSEPTEMEKEQFLTRMKALVRSGKRYFVPRTREGVTYIQQLAELGLSGIEEAWDQVLELTGDHWHEGPSYDRDDHSCGKVVWIFKMDIDGTLTYIKLKDEEMRRGCVCLSFHKDEP